MSPIRLSGTAALLALAAVPAFADTLYQSANFTGTDTGEYILTGSNVIGGVFTLTHKSNIASIGAQFGGFPGGNIFGAIVAVDPQTGLPSTLSNDLAGTALGHVVFSVSGGIHDQSADLPLTLDAGTYAVVFGTNQFGATGFAGLGWQNDPIGDPSVVRSFGDPSWFAFDEPGIRVFVNGSAVPEPMAWTMMMVGFAGIGNVLRRQRHTTISFA